MKTDIRVVSLLASSTEIICKLGMESTLLGRSHACDYPSSVLDLPSLTIPKYENMTLQSERDVVQEALSIFHVDVDLLQQLQPDVIFTQPDYMRYGLMEAQFMQAIQDVLGEGVKIVPLMPNSLADFAGDMLRIATELDVAEEGEILVETLTTRMEEIGLHTAQLSMRPTVALLEWIDPLMVAGYWMPTLVEMAGGINMGLVQNQPSARISLTELSGLNPDVIMMAPCGYDIGTTYNEMAPLLQQPQWNHLKAVRTKKVYLADGIQYFNRPGPRLMESLEILAEILHPKHFHFGHQGMGWVRL